MAKGTGWKKANPKNFNSANGNLYKTYSGKVAEASTAGKTLKDALNAEWKKQNPQGLDGLVCKFNVIGGKVMYVMTRPENAAENEGDNVF